MHLLNLKNHYKNDKQIETCKPIVVVVIIMIIIIIIIMLTTMTIIMRTTTKTTTMMIKRQIILVKIMMLHHFVLQPYELKKVAKARKNRVRKLVKPVLKKVNALKQVKLVIKLERKKVLYLPLLMVANQQNQQSMFHHLWPKHQIHWKND